MIPRTFPSILEAFQTKMVVYALPSISGLKAWIDYIPVKGVQTESFSLADTYANNGYKSVSALTNLTGKQAWIDYIPVYEDASYNKPWSTDAGGYIPTSPLAALLLDFTSGTLDPRITFTRSTTATFTNSAGLIATAAINAARFDYDPVTLAPKGLLIEEQRTNLLTYSEQFDNAAWTKTGMSISSNTAAAPDGAMSADTFTNTAGTISVIGQTRTVTPSSTADYYASIFVKADSVSSVTLNCYYVGNTEDNVSFNLETGATVISSGTPTEIISQSFGNGWRRIGFRIARDSTGLKTLLDTRLWVRTRAEGVIGDTAYLWGAQLEAGAFATSYIPTVASQVTRAADSASMTGTNFSSWYNVNEGTLFTNSQSGGLLSAGPISAEISNGTINERIITGQFVPAGVRPLLIQTGNVTVVLLESTVSPVGYAKAAGAYKINSFAGTVNGGAVLTDVVGTVPTVNKLNIGSSGISAQFLNGTIARIAYYNRRLSNTELQGITS